MKRWRADMAEGSSFFVYAPNKTIARLLVWTCTQLKPTTLLEVDSFEQTTPPPSNRKH